MLFLRDDTIPSLIWILTQVLVSRSRASNQYKGPLGIRSRSSYKLISGSINKSVITYANITKVLFATTSMKIGPSYRPLTIGFNDGPGMQVPYNKLPVMHIIFLVLLGLVLGNVILDCQDSKGLLLSDFLSLYRLTESLVFYPWRHYSDIVLIFHAVLDISRLN